MIKLIMLLQSFLLCIALNAQSRIDSVAILILDRMSSVIGDLRSCSFLLNTSYDISSRDIGLVKHSDKDQVFMSGPDKLLINSNGDKGHRSYWYNGSQLAYYSFDKSNYAIVQAPKSTLQVFDSMSRAYGIEFPAADFFYPGFTDDLIKNSEQIIFLGLTKMEGQECFHIISSAKDLSIQLWIVDDGFFLPVKMTIVYYEKEGNPQYEASFSDWKLNPELPEALFDFTPPPKATKIRLVP